MSFLENRVPPPLVLMVSLGLTFFGSHLDPVRALYVGDGQLNQTLALVCTIAGVIVALAGMVNFRTAKTTVNPLQPDRATSLVTHGVFRFTRNPMYLGMALISVAATLNAASIWGLFGLVGFVLFITRFQIVPEERSMLKLFGDEYVEYQARTRRWL